MGTFKPISGHCQCGSVAFRVTAAPEELYHCHCSMCRRVHGAVFASFGVVARSALVIERGADNLGSYASSPPVHRRFCKTCGCQLFVEDDRFPDKRWFSLGACDWPEAGPPAGLKHIYVGSKIPWLHIADGLPQYDVT